MPRKPAPPRLYLRPDDRTWIIRDKGVHRRTGCGEGDRAGAEKRLAEYIKEKYAGRPAKGGKSDTISIAEVIRVYSMEHAPSTAAPKLIGEHILALNEFWGPKKVSEIKGATCREYARDRKPSMARRQLETLRAAVRYFHKEYGLDPIPAFTMPPKHGARERWLTRKEAAALLREARGLPHLRRFILIGIYTGTRSSAILGLKWLPAIDSGWIDLEAGVLHRAGAAQRKTKKRQPPAKLPPRLAVHLARWKRLDKGIKHVVHWNGSSVQSIKKAFRSARKNASLSNDVIPHSLRHTAATWLMQKGVEMQKAAGFLGMTVEMLERTYGHHHPSFQNDAANAIGRA